MVYDLIMASLYPKRFGGKTYWYLREMGRVDGKPKMISERYLGTAADIAAATEARETAMLPRRTRHLAFGDVAAAWGVLQDLGVAAIIDEVTGPRPAGLPLSAGTYLALAALNRLVDPCSKRGFAGWWKTTAADRFTKIPASALDHRRFWDAMHAVTLEQLEEISQAIAVRIVDAFGLDCSSVALDMTNFATFIDTGNAKAPVAQRGKAKQKRSDLRLVGPDLTALPASMRATVDPARFGDLSAYDTRRVVYGTERRAILTHSPELHQSQARGFDGTTLAKAGKKLDELAATLARGKTRRPRDKVAAEITAGYRSQSEAEFSFRQMKDPHVVSFSPMHHWTEHSIRVHVFTCVLALQIAHLMRRQAERASLHLSVRELLGQLAGIGETVLTYPSTGGRPKARRMTTELTGDQQKLHETFDLRRWTPPS